MNMVVIHHVCTTMITLHFTVLHMNILKFLTLEKNCDPMCRDIDLNTPFHYAAFSGHIDIVKFLTLEMHCDPTSSNDYSDTALHLAVEGGHLDIVRFFIIEQKCDPNIPGQLNSSSLCCCVWSSPHSQIFDWWARLQSIMFKWTQAHSTSLCCQG